VKAVSLMGCIGVRSWLGLLRAKGSVSWDALMAFWGFKGTPKVLGMQLKVLPA
jgi:hypothetical protein